MNDITKRLAALALAGFMMTGTSGCGNTNNESSVRYEISEQTGQEELVGTVSLSELNMYNIIVISDFENQKKFYLTYEHVFEGVVLGPSAHYTNFEKIGSNIIIAKKYKYYDGKIESDFGEVENIIKFSPIVSKYGTVKENYDIKELLDILNMFAKDYDKYKENVKTKSLTLK